LSLAEQLVSRRLGGSCWADPPPVDALADAGNGLAVVSACINDAAASRALLDAVCARFGAARTLLLIPEDPGIGGKFRSVRRQMVQDAKHLGCRAVTGPVDPWPLLDCAAELHAHPQCTCNHAIPTLARIVGVPVHENGEIDEGPAARRHAATGLITSTAYVDPFTQQGCTAEQALEIASLWQQACKANRRIAACVGVQFWKRRRVSQFLHSGIKPPRFMRGDIALAHASATGGAIAAWASRIPPGLQQAAAAASVPILRIEDGFVRSIGLGSDFNVPCSIVVDAAGLYYDPAQPSDLETLLATHDFPPELQTRAADVIRRLVVAGTTKYGSGISHLPLLPQDGRRRILVPGQVADDLSVRLGAGAATGNADLLAKVRTENPDACIIYKPHPDVEAGHRPGALDDADVLRHADVIARGGAMAPLIAAVDEVHTMTSLAGFEALLRGRHVVVYGRPFYAGWGLTNDRAPIVRRGRTLSLEALAAGVLLLYPRYIDPVTGLPCPVEVLLDRMADTALWRAGPLVRLRRLQGCMALKLRKIIQTRAKRMAM
jgi:capsular polysaccharide export protein